jgi:hypothetical protein
VTDETPNTTAPDPTAPDPTATEPPAAGPGRALSSADTRPRRPDYRGEELDPERGPGLGCFWFQVIVLGFFIVLIPIGLKLNWPFELLAFLLFVVIGLLLLTGQSVIFLLRLVAADRRSQGRRRPLASPTKTVGELEDEHEVADAVGGARPVAAEPADAEPVEAEPAPDVPGAVAGPGEPDVLDGTADSHDSQAMIHGPEAVEPPVSGADVPNAAAASEQEVDSGGTDADDRARAGTRDGDVARDRDTATDDDATSAARMHESSPRGQRGSSVGTFVPDAATPDAAATPGPAAPPEVDESAPAPGVGPAEAPPEEPGAGVRQ